MLAVNPWPLCCSSCGTSHAHDGQCHSVCTCVFTRPHSIWLQWWWVREHFGGRGQFWWWVYTHNHSELQLWWQHLNTCVFSLLHTYAHTHCQHITFLLAHHGIILALFIPSHVHACMHACMRTAQVPPMAGPLWLAILPTTSPTQHGREGWCILWTSLLRSSTEVRRSYVSVFWDMCSYLPTFLRKRAWKTTDAKMCRS